MWDQATRAVLADGRDHWQHGPIDLIIEVWGEPAAVSAAKKLAWQGFSGILPTLVAELAALRQPLQRHQPAQFNGAVAQRMLAACEPFAAQFITPMAAVAGAVADEVMASFAQAPGITKAYVNNGGDIAATVKPGESLKIAVLDVVTRKIGTVPIYFEAPWRGVATSGWRGRSFSLGIADAVTVLAASAAQADAAATMIANAVNLEHAAIQRAPACTLKDDTDLGELLVTTAVAALPAALVAQALRAGAETAQDCVSRGLIAAALLQLQGQWHTTEHDSRLTFWEK